MQAANDATPLEVGLRFRPSLDGFITGFRFFKGPGNTGTHVGHLWTNTGQLLATANFASETASGWQTVTFPPVPVAEATTYVASVYMPNGHFALDTGYFQLDAVHVWPLKALRHGDDGPNGVYRLGSPGFPSDSVGGSNYWVDVLFDVDDHRTPTVIDLAPARGWSRCTPAPRSRRSSAKRWMPRRSCSRYGTGQPARCWEHQLRQPESAGDLHSWRRACTPRHLHGQGRRCEGQVRCSIAAPFSWTFTTTGAPGTVPTSLWDTSATPVTATVVDSPVELGVRFRSTHGGTITALRFYKAPTSAGPHSDTSGRRQVHCLPR